MASAPAIHRITARELPECLAILAAAYEASAQAFGMTEENCPYRGRTRLPLKVLEEEFAGGCRMYCCMRDGRPAGFLSICAQGGALCINDLAVLPEYQSCGIGSALLRYAISQAETEGYRKIELGMVHDNIRLRKWYERFGFRTLRLIQYPAVTYTVGTMQLNIE